MGPASRSCSSGGSRAPSATSGSTSQQRLGTLLFGRIGDASGALSYLEQVLRERPAADRGAAARREDPRRARAALARGHRPRGGLRRARRGARARARARDPPRVRDEADERRDLLRRVAELRDERLRDDAGALEAFARLLAARPRRRARAAADAGDRAAARRPRARRRGARRPRRRRRAAPAPARRDPDGRGAPLREPARRRRRAPTPSTGRSCSSRPTTRPSRCPRAGRSSGSTRRRGQPAALRDPPHRGEARGRRRRAARAPRPARRALRDRARRSARRDRGVARAARGRSRATRRRSSALDRLYERTQSWRELVDVLRARERAADDRDARRTLLVRIATTLADKLTDVTEAILAYRDGGRRLRRRPRVARVAGDALRARRPLAGSRRHARGRPRRSRSRPRTSSRSSPAWARCGRSGSADVAGCARGVPAGARRSIRPTPRAARRSRRCSRTRTRGARRRRSCGPLYEADGLHQKLLRVLEIEAEYADSVSGQAGQHRAGGAGRRGTARRRRAARSRTPRAGSARPWPSPSCRSGSSAPSGSRRRPGSHAELVELLRVGRGRDPRRRPAARGHAAHRRDRADAPRRSGARAASTTRGRSSCGATTGAPSWRSSRSTRRRATTRRSSISSSGAPRPPRARRSARQLLFKQARLCDEKLGDAARGHRRLRADPRPGARRGGDRGARAPLRAAPSAGRTSSSLYERQIAAPGASNERKAALHHALGSVLEQRMNEVDRAFDEYAAALAIDPKHPQTVASLEALMGEREHGGARGRDARAGVPRAPRLAPRDGDARGAPRRRARTPTSAGSSCGASRRCTRSRRRTTARRSRRPRSSSPRTRPTRAPGPSSSASRAWPTPRRAWRRSSPASSRRSPSDEPATARLAQRTGELFEAHKDVDARCRSTGGPTPSTRRPANGTFEAIDRLLREADRPAERVAALPRRRSTTSTSPPSGSTALHTIALIEEAELHDDAAAIETYRAALDVDDEDAARARGALAPLRAHRALARPRGPDAAPRRAERAARRTRRASAWSSRSCSSDKLGEPQARHRRAAGRRGARAARPPGPGRRGRRRARGAAPGARAQGARGRHPAPDLRARGRLAAPRRGQRASGSRSRPTTASGSRILRETARALGEARRRSRQAPSTPCARRGCSTRRTATRASSSTASPRRRKRWDELASAYETAIAKTDGLDEARAPGGARAAPRQAARRPAARARRVGPALRARRDGAAAARGDGRAGDAAQRLADARPRAHAQGRARAGRRDAREHLAARRRGQARHARRPAGRHRRLRARAGARAGERVHARQPHRALRAEERRGAARRSLPPPRRAVRRGRRGPQVPAARRRGEALRERSDRPARGHRVAWSRRSPCDRATRDVLRRLDALYTQERLWPELLDNLQAAGRRGDGRRRRRRRCRSASPRSTPWSSRTPQAALEAYREVLESGFDAEAAAAIRSIGETHDELRARRGRRPRAGAARGGPARRAAPRSSSCACARRPSRPTARGRCARWPRWPRRRSATPTARESALLRALAEEPQDADAARRHRAPRRHARGARAGSATPTRCRSARRRSSTRNVAADLFVRLGRVERGEARRPVARREGVRVGGRADGRRPRRPRGARPPLRASRRHAGPGRRARAAHRGRGRGERAGGPACTASPACRSASSARSRRGSRRCGRRSSGCRTTRASRAALEKLLEDDALFDDAFDALEFVLRALGLSEELAKLYERRVSRARVTARSRRTRGSSSRACSRSASGTSRERSAPSRRRSREDPVRR